jgi:hypothetical protein
MISRWCCRIVLSQQITSANFRAGFQWSFKRSFLAPRKSTFERWNPASGKFPGITPGMDTVAASKTRIVGDKIANAKAIVASTFRPQSLEVKQPLYPCRRSIRFGQFEVPF